MGSPELYVIGLKNECFSISIFFKYIFYAMIQAAFIYLSIYSLMYKTA